MARNSCSCAIFLPVTHVEREREERKPGSTVPMPRRTSVAANLAGAPALLFT